MIWNRKSNWIFVSMLVISLNMPINLFGQDYESLVNETYDNALIQEFVTEESVPESSEEYVQLGIFLLTNNNYSEARQNILHSITIDSSDQLRKYYFLARSEAGLGNYDQSKFYLEKLLSAGYGVELILRTPELAPESFRSYRHFIIKYGLKIRIWDIIFGIVSGIGIFLGISFLIKKKDKRYSIYIGLFLLAFSLNILEYVLYWTRYILYLPVRGFFLVLLFLYPPLLYLYIRKNLVTKVTGDQTSWLKNQKHFIAFYISLFVLLIYWSFPSQHQETIFQGMMGFLANIWLKVAFSFLYLLLIINIIRKRIESSNKYIVAWLKILITFYILAIVGYFLPWIFSSIDNYSIEYEYVLAMVHCVFVFIILILSIMQPAVFIGNSIPNALLKSLKYRNSGLTSSMSQELMEKVIHLMIQEKLYLDNDLTLSKLSEIVGVDKYAMSQVINENFGKGFYQLINEFRIKEARKVLLRTNKNINDILYEVGFSNHTSFYKAFKKHTKKTPSEYILQNRNHDN